MKRATARGRRSAAGTSRPRAAARRPPLAGIRVLDLSRVLAGPYCGALLADLGADVIRVEHPTQLDEVRAWAPVVDGVSAAFIAVNHSKRGVAIDLSHPEGLEVFQRLLKTADVLVENFRPGTLERYGLGAARLRALNRRLIHCAIRAFPDGTSMAGMPGYETSVQAYTGVMSVTGEHDGDPVRCGVSVNDLGTGMASVIAVLSALRERDRTGIGGYVEPALLRTATSLLCFQIVGYFLAGVQPQRRGSGHDALVPYQNFRCSDGLLSIAAGNDRLWARLCDALKLRDAAGARPFPTLASRVTRRDAVAALVGAAAAGWKRMALWKVLTDAGIPAMPVNTVAEYVADPTLREAGVLDGVRIAGHAHEIAMPGPLFETRGPRPRRRPPPHLGEHTQSVLRELGYTRAEIRRLQAGGGVQ